jgi:uncharacterized membrane protein
MPRHESSIEVDVPQGVAYQEWTDYGAYPSFMDGVHEVQVLDDGRIRWRADLGSRQREWEAEVATDAEGGRVTWRSVTGAQHDGDVTLTPTADGGTSVKLLMTYDDAGDIEGAGAAAKAVRERVEGTLRAFRRHVEALEEGRREAEQAASRRGPPDR